MMEKVTNGIFTFLLVVAMVFFPYGNSLIAEENSSINDPSEIVDIDSENPSTREIDVTPKHHSFSVLQHDFLSNETVIAPLTHIELPLEEEFFDTDPLTDDENLLEENKEVDDEVVLNKPIREPNTLDKFSQGGAHTKNFNSKIKSFVFTDDNENENLIITTDKRDYFGLTENEVYFSVKNIGTTAEMVNVQVYFPEEKGQVQSISQWVENIPLVQGKPYLQEEKFVCLAGWEQIHIDSNVSLVQAKRYANYLARSLFVVPYTLASVIGEIFSDRDSDSSSQEELPVIYSNTNSSSDDDSSYEEVSFEQEVQVELELENEEGEEGFQEQELEQEEVVDPLNILEPPVLLEEEITIADDSSQKEQQQEYQETENESEETTIIENETTFEHEILETLPEKNGSSHQDEEVSMEENILPEDGTIIEEKSFENNEAFFVDQDNELEKEEEVFEESEENLDEKFAQNIFPFDRFSRYYCSEREQEFNCSYLSDDDTNCVVRTVPDDQPIEREYNQWQELPTRQQELRLPNTLLKKVLGKAIKQKPTPEYLSVDSATQLDRRHQYITPIAPNETAYFKMTIEFPRGSSGEFYIEAIGDKNGYGHLDPWWDSSWSHAQTILIDNTDHTDSLEEFQILVEIDDTLPDFWDTVKSDGGDIRFLDTTETTELAYALLYFNQTEQRAKIWVKVDEVLASSTTNIYLYYGNASATSTSSFETTFSYTTQDNRWYVVSDENANTDASALTFFDNNEFTLGGISDTDWDLGSTDNPKTIDTLEYVPADFATATKPFAISADSVLGGEMWIPSVWQSTVLMSTTPRNPPINYYVVNPSSVTANIDFYRLGSIEGTLNVGPGAQGIYTYSATNTNFRYDAHSNTPILIAKYTNNITLDHMVIPPPATHWHGVLSSQNRMVCLDNVNVTTATIYYSNGTSGTLECATPVTGSTTNWPVIGGALGAGPSYYLVADGLVTTYSYEDNTGDEMYTGYRDSDLDLEYLVPTGYDYVACSAPYNETTISIFDMDGVEVATSGNLGNNGIYPHHYRDNTTRTGSHRISANHPIFCYYDDAATDGERNLANRVLNRKYVPDTLTVSFETLLINTPDDAVVHNPFNNEKVPTTTPSFEFSATDAENTDIRYQIRWDFDSEFSFATVRTSDTDAGFENTETPADMNPFNAGEGIRYTIQSADSLTNGETYWYQIRASYQDSVYGAWSAPRSFTVDTEVSNSTWHQTTDAQFNQNTFNGTEVTGLNSVKVLEGGTPYTKVQYIEAIMPSNATSVDWIIPETISHIENAFIVFQGGLFSSNVLSTVSFPTAKARIEFLDTDTLRITRNEAPSFTPTDVTYSLYIIEARQDVVTPAFSVQHGSTNVTGGQGLINETISTVDPDKSLVLVSNQAHNTTASHHFFKGELTSGTNLALTRAGTTGAVTVAWQVITFHDDFVLRKGNLGMASGVTSANDTISSVDLDRSVVFATWTVSAGTANQSDRVLDRFWLSSSTTVNVDRQTGTSNIHNIHYTVVQFPEGVLVQSDNNSSSPTTAGITDVPLTHSIHPDYTFTNLSFKKNGGSRFSYPISSFLDNDTLRLESINDVTTLGTNTVTYYVVDTSGYFETSAGAGTIMSSEIHFDDGNRDSNNSAWSEVSFTADETEGQVSLKLYFTDVLPCDTIIPDVDVPGNSAGLSGGIDISGLNSLTYNRLCLEATLVADSEDVSPFLLDWSVTWGSDDDPGPGEEQTLSFSLETNAVGFGILGIDAPRYATGNGEGSLSAVAAHNLSAQTNAEDGYSIQFKGSSLVCVSCTQSATIAALSTTPSAPSPGYEQFGLRANTVLGTGLITSPYNTSDFAYGTPTTAHTLVTGLGDETESVYELYYMANIAPDTTSGLYETIITYTITANF